MKIFISDLHLGDGSKTDDFRRDKEFIDFLNHINGLSNFDELIVLGDLFELWQSDLDKIMWKHRDVIRALQFLEYNHRLTFIHGNHDYLPFSKLTNHTYQIDSIFAQHGHQYDVFNRYKNPLFSLKWPVGKYISVLVAEFERRIHPDVDAWAEKMEQKFGKFLWEAAKLQNVYYANDTRILQNFNNLYSIASHKICGSGKVIIFGHTHQADLKEMPRGIYANTGAWVDSVVPTYVTVDDNKVELRNGLDYSLIKSIER